jgi:hypothetical protein
MDARVLIGVAVAGMLMALTGSSTRPGVAPATPWACPESHPIKGYATTQAGHRVYYLPGAPFYEEASPDRCYASEAEAARDGSHPAQRTVPVPRTGDDLA